MNTLRILTHDEIKASEAAFHGRPFNVKWSKAARSVYDGLVEAMGKGPALVRSEDQPLTKAEASEISVEMLNQLEPDSVVISDVKTLAGDDVPVLTQPNHITSRTDAVKAGLVVDVTQLAKHLGLHWSVGITKSLWERSITGSSTISSEEWRTRVRDMLLAVRLRLASLESPTPWIQVQVLLAHEQDQTPQLFPIYALFHNDPIVAECLTLIHPQEISSINMSKMSSSGENTNPEEGEQTSS